MVREVARRWAGRKAGRRRALPVLAAVGLLALLLLAGCGNKAAGVGQVRLGDGERISLDLPPEQQPAPDDIRGAVSGIVVDEAIFPLPGAVVTVRDRDWTATADENGLFTFLDVPPGLYSLVASLDDHADGLGTVNVRSGQVTKSILQAQRLPFVSPYHTTWEFQEVRRADEVLYGTPGNHEHLVAFDRKPATVVLESVWQDMQDSVVFGSPLLYSLHGERDPDSGDDGYAPNPFVKSYEAGNFSKGEYAVRVRVFPNDFATPVEVQGRVFVTVFYVDPAPADWSFLGGSP